MFHRLIALALVVALIAAGLHTAPTGHAQAPGSAPWPTATPESQGMDSEKLANMLTIIREMDLNINSVLVIRSGSVVLDAYIHPYTPDEPHMVHSVTKSFTSALIGIAIAEGYIQGVDQRIADIFPDKMPADPDPRKGALTIKDLLTMSAGLRCRDSAAYDYQGMREIRNSADWVAHILALPMNADPGTTFEYCNSASFLLAAIIQKTTGQTALEYAREKLFDPLGFGAVEWRANPEGFTIGWGEMFITPRDMAKLGYLYLRNGEWNGAQIIPAEWIAASATPHSYSPHFGAHYGYQWWIESADVYAAEGTGGQYIFVVPGLDLVAVFTSGLSENLYRMPQALLENSIIPAALATDPLPDNPDALADLTALVDSLAHPRPKPVPPLPDIAETVSGVTYAIDPNPAGIEALMLTFEPGADVGHLRVTFANREYTFAIGLDGLYRATDIVDGIRVYFRGEWVADHLVLNETNMYGPADAEYRFTFDDDRLTVTIRERVMGDIRVLTGTRQ